MRHKIATLVLACIACALCAGALFYTWLLRNPFNIDELSPRIVSTIQAQIPGLKINFGTITLQRDPLRSLVKLKAQNVLLNYAPDISAQARIQRLEVGLDQWALLDGRVEIIRVQLDGVSGTLNVSKQLLTELLAQDPQKPKRFTWPENLKRVDVNNASFALKYDSATLQKPYQLNIDMLSILQGRLLNKNMRASTRFVLKDAQTQIAALVTTEAEKDNGWAARIMLNSPNLEHLSQFAPWPDAIRQHIPALAAPVRIKADVTARPLIEVRLNITGAQGALTLANLYDKPLPLSRFSGALSWREVDNLLEINDFTALLETIQLSAQGKISLQPGGVLALKAQVDALNMAQLVQLWPPGAAPNARAWTRDNIVAGGIRKGMATLSGTLTSPQVNFRFGFEDLLVHYRRPMPALEKASGIGVLTNNGLALTLSSGTINTLQAASAVVRIEPFNRRPTNAIIELPLKGQLPKLLAILDSPPLGFISRYGIAPTSVLGDAQGVVSLTIPLIKELQLDNIDFAGSVRVRQTYIPDIYAGKPLSGADLDIRVTPQGLRALGKGQLGMVALNSIEWSEAFKNTTKSPTLYKISAQPTVQALSDLGIDLSTFAKGSLAVSLQLSGRGGGIERGAFTADLRNTQLSLPLLNTIKANGLPAQISSRIELTPDQVRLPNLRLKGPELAFSGVMSIPLKEGASNRLSIERADIGDLSASGALEYKEGQPTYVTLTADRFNLAPYLQAYLKPGPENTTAPDVLNGQTTENVQPVHLHARVASIDLLGGVSYDMATLDMVTQGTQLLGFKAEGSLAKQDETTLSLTRAGATKQFSLKSKNAAQLFKGLDLFSNAQGGILSIQAQAQEGTPSLVLSGIATLKDFRVLNTPRLAQILTIASLTGLADSLAGRGIEFEDVNIPFSLQRGIITLGKSSAIGPAMGVTLEGQIDQRTNQTALRGVIIPSYTLNAMLGKIPLLGKVLVGGKKQGLIGFNYRVEGALNAPKISVNPASGLAPGFLRRLFQGSKPRLPEVEDSATLPGVRTPPATLEAGAQQE